MPVLNISHLQGCSILAIQYLFNRFLYSLVWCNKTNCVGILDSLLQAPVRIPATKFNIGKGFAHKCDPLHRPMAVISPQGKWEGKTDGGKGSPVVR